MNGEYMSKSHFLTGYSLGLYAAHCGAASATKLHIKQFCMASHSRPARTWKFTEVLSALNGIEPPTLSLYFH